LKERNSEGSSAGYFIYVNQTTGLIDNCSLKGGAGNSELIYARGPVDAWTTPDYAGTDSAVYVENCTFSGLGYVCDANSNSRMVLRYNAINASGFKIDEHGMDSNVPARSFRLMEAYGNVYSGGSEQFAIRGATGYLFDNRTSASPTTGWFQLINYGCIGAWKNYGTASASVAVGNPATVTASQPHGWSTGWTAYVVIGNSTPAIAGYYVITVTGANTFTIPVNVTVAGAASGANYVTRQRTPLDYPTYDQVGRGQQIDGTVYNDSSAPFYLWNNTATISGNSVDWTLNWKTVNTTAINIYRAQTGNPSATFTMQDMIAADRDYFKQTVGGTFDGTAAITVTASAGTLTGTTLASNVVTAEPPPSTVKPTPGMIFVTPSTPAAGSPVQFVSVPLVGVPRSGVTNVGDVARASPPVPVLLAPPSVSTTRVLP